MRVDPTRFAIEWYQMARAGKVGELLESIGDAFGDDIEDQLERDAEIYKWLLVAEDSGADVEGDIDFVLEVSTLKYDYEGGTRIAVHGLLADAYREGSAPIPRNDRLARAHALAAQALLP